MIPTLTLSSLLVLELLLVNKILSMQSNTTFIHPYKNTAPFFCWPLCVGQAQISGAAVKGKAFSSLGDGWEPC